MDLQTQQEEKLSYLQYYFLPNGTHRGSILRDTSAVLRTETIYDPETVTEVIFVRGQESCAYRDNLYFIDDSFVLHYPADFQALDPEFVESRHRLEKCDSVQSIENVGGDTLIIRCLNGQTVLYDTCTSIFMYPSIDYVPYPCSNWDVVLYWNGSSQTLRQNNGGKNNLENANNLPLSGFSYGTCVQGEEGEEPMFVGLASDGTVFIAPLDGRNMTNISQGENMDCSGNMAMTCYRPVFSDSRRVFGMYDVGREEFIVVNLTVGCQYQPIVVRMNLSVASFSPDLVAISSRIDRYNCGFQGDSTKPASIRATSHAVSTVNMRNVSTTLTLNATEILVTESTDISVRTVLVVTIPIGAFVLSLGILVGIIVLLIYLSQ